MLDVMAATRPPDDVAAALAATVTLRRADAEDLADLLRRAGALCSRLLGVEAAEAACAELADPDHPGLQDLMFELLLASGDLLSDDL